MEAIVWSVGIVQGRRKKYSSKWCPQRCKDSLGYAAVKQPPNLRDMFKSILARGLSHHHSGIQVMKALPGHVLPRSLAEVRK